MQAALNAELYDDPLRRIVLTGGAIKRGPQALQKHLSALGDMMERVLASMDHCVAELP